MIQKLRVPQSASECSCVLCWRDKIDPGRGPWMAPFLFRERAVDSAQGALLLRRGQKIADAMRGPTGGGVQRVDLGEQLVGICIGLAWRSNGHLTDGCVAAACAGAQCTQGADEKGLHGILLFGQEKSHAAVLVKVSRAARKAAAQEAHQ